MPAYTHNQREEEKRDFESTLASSLLRKLEMEYSIENQDPPDPDILVPIPNIGIELIRYIRKSDSVKDEGAISKIIRNSEKKYREQGGKLNAHIWLWPSAIANFHKRSRIQIESLSDEIVNFALANKEGTFDFSDNRDEQFDGIIKEIELFDDEFRKYWQVPSAGIISFFPEIISKAISSKEQKIQNYTRKFDEIWLLIHSTSGCCIGSPNSQDMFASTFKIEDGAKAIKHSGKFNRVFLLDFFGNILELDKE
jgi:hypothetical protein